MVSKRKQEELKKLKELIEKYPVIGILDYKKMPSSPLQQIKKALKGKAVIKMFKKNIIKKAIEASNKKDILKLIDFIQGQPAVIFTEMDPFKLYKFLEKEKSPAFAKEGDIAVKDIVVKAGPTPLLAGPAIGELQRFKIPTMVQDGKIHVRENKVVAKKGEVITAELASVLRKLGIQPMEIGLNLLACYENGIVFTREVLAVDTSAYISDIQKAFMDALTLSIEIFYPTKENIEILIKKAFMDAKTLGVNAEIFDKGVIEELLKKAGREVQVLGEKIKI